MLLLGFLSLELMSLPFHYKSLVKLGPPWWSWFLYDGAVSPEKTESNSKSLVCAAGRRQERLSLFIKIYDHRLHSYDGNSIFVTFHSGKFLQSRIFFNKTFIMNVSEGISGTCFVFVFLPLAYLLEGNVFSRVCLSVSHILLSLDPPPTNL